MKRNTIGVPPQYDNKGIRVATSDSWRTPQPLFDKLNAEFHFEVDLAATKFNHKCAKYYTIDNDAFMYDWKKCSFANIPYSKPGLWFTKAAASIRKYDNTIVLLTKVATSEAYWVKNVCHADVRFLAGRIKFWDENDTPHYSATFGSALVIFTPKSYNKPTTEYWNYKGEIPERLF